MKISLIICHFAKYSKVWKLVFCTSSVVGYCEQRKTTNISWILALDRLICRNQEVSKQQSHDPKDPETASLIAFLANNYFANNLVDTNSYRCRCFA